MNAEMGPYEGQNFELAIQRLKDNPRLLKYFTEMICRKAVNPDKAFSFAHSFDLDVLLNSVHNYTDFQEKITCDLFLKLIELSSIDNFTFGGIENIGDKPHIYVSNHRDIVLDTSMLDLALYRSGKSMCEMVIGDNLLFSQFALDMFKVNGAITVRRNLTSATELRQETLNMSNYIRHVLEDKKKSVWIAQKSGRAKDGKDDTSTSILKMLYLSYREDKKSFEEFINSASIIPVAISYQYDPCDIRKSIKEKKKNTDLIDIVRGLRNYKGNVHIQFGKELDSICEIKDAVGEIDRQIHCNYRLWDTNFFCYDKIEHSEEFKSYYCDFDSEKFLRRYKNQRSEVVDFVLNGYANSVRSLKDEKGR